MQREESLENSRGKEEWGDVLTSEREMEGDVQFGKMKT